MNLRPPGAAKPDYSKLEKNPLWRFNNADQPPQPATRELVREAAETLSCKQLIDPMSNREFGAAFYTPDQPSDRSVIMPLGFMACFGYPSVREEIASVGLASGANVIALEEPGHGTSSHYDKELWLDTARAHFSSTAQSMWRALVEDPDLLQENLSLVGMSLGARVALSMALEADRKIDNMCLIDLPDISSKFIPLTLAKYALGNVIWKKAYEDSVGPENIASNKGAHKAVKDLGTYLLTLTKSMSSDTAYYDLEKFLKKQPLTKVNCTSAQNSEISTKFDRDYLYWYLAQRFSNFSISILPGDTHAFPTGNPERLAYHLTRNTPGRQIHP